MAQFHLPTLEEAQLAKWKENQVVERIIARAGDLSRKPFVFFEGPPGANGVPGIHHVLSRSLKDVQLRFRTMQGYRIDRKAGWDTHGLPVELAVEKRLGFTKKQDIETYGIAQFNDICKDVVWEFLDTWNAVTERIAYWIDLKSPYVTYHNDYIESLWWVTKQISNRQVDGKSLLFKGTRTTPHCPRCVTSLSSHELAQGYKDAEDPSVFIRFPVAGREKTYLLAWTTTPWTLPANVALAVGASITYVEVQVGEETLILAQERLSVLDSDYKLIREFHGSELVGTKYIPLFRFTALPLPASEQDRAYHVYAADFVSTTDGTGIVHIAPAYGEDDARLGTEHNLPLIQSVDAGGMVILDVPGKGEFFKKADRAIADDLTARGLLYKEGKITHTYPFCWRCGTPIIYMVKSSWFIGMSRLRRELVETNQKIAWTPEHFRDGRFGEWLKEAKDWALSRERYWGTPLPIWECKHCGTHEVIGGLDELKSRSHKKNRYFLMRHGEGTHNLANIAASWPEANPAPHLTEKGRANVQAAAAKLKAENIDLIIASDLERTKETAAIVAAELGLEVTFDERIRELNLGIGNGMKVDDYHKLFASRLERFTKALDGGESLTDARRRMVGVIKELQSKYAGKNILIVSHGDPIWLLESGFNGLSNEQTLTAAYPEVGEVREIKVERLPYNQDGHLDLHRPFIDDVTLVCQQCHGDMKRIPDVADVWYDSGAMPFAQWHFPFENRERINLPGEPTNTSPLASFPGDYIAEGVDQTRGWFYTLLAVSVAMGYSEPPFKSVVTTGLVLDKQGKKMSKSKGNVIAPQEVADTLGIDALRFFFYSASQPGDDKLYDPKALEDITKKVFMILWNVLSFWQMNVSEGSVAPTNVPTSNNYLDQWLVARVSALVNSVTSKLSDRDYFTSSRELAEFVNDLSTWYIRRSRDRFKSEGAERDTAIAVLGWTLRTVSLVMAPFTPFIADALYQAVGGNEDSVHLEQWPKIVEVMDQEWVGTDDNPGKKVMVIPKKDSDIIHQMDAVRNAASAGLKQRADSGVTVRQALSSATVTGPIQFTTWMCEILADELNVHDVHWQQGSELVVTLDTTLTPELLREGAARELVRNINDLRKQLKLTIADRVTVAVDGSEFWKQVVEENQASLIVDTRADAINFGGLDNAEAERELETNDEKAMIRIRKI